MDTDAINRENALRHAQADTESLGRANTDLQAALKQAREQLRLANIDQVNTEVELQRAQEERDIEQQGRQGAERRYSAAIERGKRLWAVAQKNTIAWWTATELCIEFLERAEAAERDAEQQRALAEVRLVSGLWLWKIIARATGGEGVTLVITPPAEAQKEGDPPDPTDPNP